MRWTVATLCAIAGVATLRLAAAEPAPAPTPAVAVAAAPGATAPAPDPRTDAAWQLYHDTFAALMQGEPTRARDLASALLRDYPDHPATRLVRGAHLGLAPGAVDEHGDTAQRPDDRDAPSSGARAELALFQSLHGIALGIEACIAVKCDSAEAYLGIALAGGAAGGLISVSLHDLTPGQRALLNSGTSWGAVNAALLLIASNPSDAQTASLMLMAGQGAGLLAGATLSSLHPTAGQVALANSGGEWVGVVSALAIDAADPHTANDARAIAALVAVDAGIAGGAYLASRWPRVSRAQTLVIDAGGIVGTVGGAAIGIVISGNGNDRSTSALAAAGAVLGLGAAAYVTRDWSDDSASSVQAYVAPPAHGHGGIAGVGFSW